MITRALICFTVLSLMFFSTEAQDYRFPLDIDLSMSANFGELRTDHFHAGIDLRVGGTVGAKVYAIESGHVSRIYISGTGYGKALYIEHPDGHTSVYAHLDAFAGAIADYVTDYQYRRQRFRMNDYTDEKSLPVKKGDVIGYAGNTGSSFGAHLHFEIRESQRQIPLNIVTNGFITPKDNIPPVFHRVALFTLDTINDVTRPRLLNSERMVKKSKSYVPEKKSVFEVCNPVFIGVNANDYQPGTTNRYGIYQMKVFLDDELFYSFKIDEFEFRLTKYINSFIAYDELFDKNIFYIKTYLEDGNKVPFYGTVKNHGLIVLKDTLTHNVRIELYDDLKNKSTSAFKIRRSSKVATRHQQVNPAQFITVQRLNPFEYYEDGLEVSIEPESLYSNSLFKVGKTSRAGTYSPVWNIGYENIPLHNYMTIKIKPVNLPKRLRQHAFIAKLDKDGVLHHYGGQFDANGFLVTRVPSFGSYFVLLDTIPPKVSISAKSNNFSSSSRLTVTLDDEHSGIESCDGYIDGKWMLFEHDPKSRTMTYRFDKLRMVDKGKKRKLKVVVTDKCKNSTTFLYNFIY